MPKFEKGDIILSISPSLNNLGEMGVYVGLNTDERTASVFPHLVRFGFGGDSYDVEVYEEEIELAESPFQKFVRETLKKE